MNSAPDTLPLTRRSILAQAWPIMLGQASVPLVGLVDATVIGRTGDAAALAGVALGSSIIALIFWSFGFLRMGVSGLVAQASGARDGREVEALLWRGIALGLALGLAITALRWPLVRLAFWLLPGGGAIGVPAEAFVRSRFVGAPAALAVFAITGWLIGLGRSRAALVLQLVINFANLGLDGLFVWHFHWGASGVGAGTALAEWIGLATGLALTGRGHHVRLVRDWPWLLQGHALLRLFTVNRDLMVRTMALLLLFTWFANAGARLGAPTLAANHVLMQFVGIAAFVLDAFAFTAEQRIGHAIGAGRVRAFDRALRLTAEFALGGGLVLGLACLAGGAAAITLITDPTVRLIALTFLPAAALAPALGASSWLLDGVFIGATQGRALRNAAVVSTACYLMLDLVLRPWGNLGVWLALLASYLLRTATLGWHLPALRRAVVAGQAAAC